jgi:hypothetical protein
MKVDWHKRSCNRFVPTILQKQPPHAVLMTSIMHRRMRIEEMFGDLKKHGFDLESTMLHLVIRLSRLTLAVVLLYVWLVSVGVKAVHARLRHLADRGEWRDLCVFQTGLRFIERRLIKGLSFN